MKKYRFLIAYDGTAYSGWQRQPHALSIQEQIESILSQVLQSPSKIVGAGRTDSGVHALGQVAHAELNSPYSPKDLCYKVNCLLPGDIRLLSIEKTSPDFHAIHSSIAKRYVYRLWRGKDVSPFLRAYCTPVSSRLDFSLVPSAAKILEGRHDFGGFANSQLEGCAAKNAVRTIYQVRMLEEGGLISFVFEGNGFLYKMVRNMTGCLLELAAGKRDVASIAAILEEKDRQKAGLCAPAQGLMLEKVYF